MSPNLLSFLSWQHIPVATILGLHSTYSLPDKSHLYLDALGIAGAFGGDEAASALAAVHVYGNSQWWLGWHNTPGSYQMARRFGLLAKSRFLDCLRAGVHTDPATLFESDASKGPMFRAAHSGTITKETSHMAALLMAECAVREGKSVEGENRHPVRVTIAKFKDDPVSRIRDQKLASPRARIISTIPVAASIGACIACGLFRDWYSFSLIFSGIITSGISCLTIGSAKFMFAPPYSPDDFPEARGDGILYWGPQFVLLEGAGKGTSDSITSGKFSLNFSSERQYKNLLRCSMLLKLHSIAQLLLVPKCSLFGQIMFASSLGVSWIYNLWLSSLDKERVQRNLLFNNVLGSPELIKYDFGTRAAAAVFILLVLRPEEPTEILNELLPHDTKVWKRWKQAMLQRILDDKLDFCEEDWESDDFTEEQRTSFKKLYSDARAAFDSYDRHISFESSKSPLHPSSPDTLSSACGH